MEEVCRGAFACPPTPRLRVVDRILSSKTADPKADTTEQEAEIDRLVYGLYGLTPGSVA